MNQLKYNVTPRTQQPMYIVIHDTGNTGKGANANSHFKYFNSGDRQASADFFVDDTQALQVNDYTKYYTWHCGDGKGKYGITNANSLGIEICVNSDGDYDKAVENAVALVRDLMKKTGIDANHVVRHYDASGKKCPSSMSTNGWAKWYDFKEKISKVETTMDNNASDWAQDAVLWAISKGILKGDENGNLKLHDTMTTERFLVFLYRYNQAVGK